MKQNTYSKCLQNNNRVHCNYHKSAFKVHSECDKVQKSVVLYFEIE